LPFDWSVKKVKHIFNIGRGRVISQEELIDDGEFPVYSSQTANDGCLGFISTFDFDCDQLTWTTDGANAGRYSCVAASIIAQTYAEHYSRSVNCTSKILLI
jgi:restriction endonuclease S subunit